MNTAPLPFPVQLSGGCGLDVTLEYSLRSEIARQQSEKHMNSPSHVCSLSTKLGVFLCPAYVLDDERVAGDSLHGFEQEAGQRHSLTPGIHG